MKLATALVISAIIAGVAVWLMIEHRRTNDQIERLERELQKLKENPPKKPEVLQSSSLPPRPPGGASWL